jgi:hypothetical protein
MTNFLIKSFVAILLLLLSEWSKSTKFAERLKERYPYFKKKSISIVILLPAILVALVVVGTTELVDYIDRYFKQAEVSVNTKQISDKIIEVRIKNSSVPLENLVVELPLMGIVTGIVENSNAIERGEVIKSARGSVLPNGAFGGSTHAEISIKALSEMAEISFQIIYKPLVMPGGLKIELIGFDRYSYSYSWLYKGDRISRTHYAYYCNNMEAQKPFGRASHLVVSSKSSKDIGDAPPEKKIFFP